jgi:MT0933-like antitoxin protein
MSRAVGATRPEGDTVGMMDKAKDALNSDKGEQISDKGLDKGEQLADQKTGGTHDAQIDKGRGLADGKLGNQ